MAARAPRRLHPATFTPSLWLLGLSYALDTSSKPCGRAPLAVQLSGRSAAPPLVGPTELAAVRLFNGETCFGGTEGPLFDSLVQLLRARGRDAVREHVEALLVVRGTQSQLPCSDLEQACSEAAR